MSTSQAIHLTASRYDVWCVILFLLMAMGLGWASADDEPSLGQIPPDRDIPYHIKHVEAVEARFREAERAYREKRWEEAMELYERLVQEFPEMPSTHAGVGASAAALGNYSRAIDALRRALGLLPDAPPLQGKLADAYRRNKQLDKAEKWYQKAIKAAKERASASWHIGLGLIETERGDYEKSQQHYRDALELDSSSTVAYHNLGMALLRNNSLDEADAAFCTELELDDTIALAYIGRGQVAERRHEFEAANGFYSRATEIDPDEPSFHYAHARVLLRLGNQDEAQRVLELYRCTQAQAYYREACRLMEMRQSAKALDWLQKAIQIDPNFTEAMQTLAYLRMRTGKHEIVKDLCRQILAIKPDSIRARFYLGIAEIELGNLESAESILMELIQQEPGFPDSYPQLARIQELREDLLGAESVFDMGIQRVPGWAVGHWGRGKIRRKHGDNTGAEADFRYAIALNPESPFPRDSLARQLADEERDLDEALKLAKSAVATGSRPEHRATLALVYHLLGKTGKARDEIERAYQHVPDHPNVISLRARILNFPPDGNP